MSDKLVTATNRPIRDVLLALNWIKEHSAEGKRLHVVLHTGSDCVSVDTGDGNYLSIQCHAWQAARNMRNAIEAAATAGGD